jgi:glutathione S-transferase
MMEARIRARLERVAAHLGEAEWLDGAFSAGDLMMVSVLQRIAGSALLAAFPSLTSYIARAEARPAYKRAFAAQLAVFEAASAKKA